MCCRPAHPQMVGPLARVAPEQDRRCEGSKRPVDQLHRSVCEVLEGAGFPIGERVMSVESAAEGVWVRWRPDYTLLRPAIELGHIAPGGTPKGYGQGIWALMAAAAKAVLEGSGYLVHLREGQLFVTAIASRSSGPELP